MVLPRISSATWIGLGAVTLAALAATSVENATPSLVMLRPGDWYRVTGLSRRIATSDAVRADLLSSGFADAPLVSSPNPGSPRSTWTAIGIWGPVARWGSALLGPSRLLAVSSIRRVAQPDLTAIAPRDVAGLDPGLSDDEVHYLLYAVEEDRDPAHLSSFGGSFLPDFPLAATTLLAKARILELSTTRRGARLPAAFAMSAARAFSGTSLTMPLGRQGRGSNVPLSPDLRSPPGQKLGSVTAVAGRENVVGGQWSVVSPRSGNQRPTTDYRVLTTSQDRGPTTDYRLPTTARALVGASASDVVLFVLTGGASQGLEWLAGAIGDYLELARSIWTEYRELTPVEQRIVDDALSGKNIPDSVLSEIGGDTVRAAKAIRAGAPILALAFAATGVGLGVLVAFEIAAAIALGDADIADLALESVAAAIPLGYEARQAFLLAARATRAAFERKPADQATVAALRGLVVQAGGDGAGAAFDVASGVAQGRRVDDAALIALRNIVRQYAGEDAAVAFDYGVAVAEGQSLQRAGYPLVYRYFQSATSSELDKIRSFQDYAILASQEGRQVVDYVGNEIARSLSAYAPSELDALVRPIVQRVLTDPGTPTPSDEQVLRELSRTDPFLAQHWNPPTDASSTADDWRQYVQTRAYVHGVAEAQAIPRLADQSYQDVSRTLHVPETVARAALASVQELPGGVIVPNRRILGRIFPRAPEEIPVWALSELRSIAQSTSSVMRQLRPDYTTLGETLARGTPSASSAVQEEYARQRAKSKVLRDRWIALYKLVEQGRIDLRRISP